MRSRVDLGATSVRRENMVYIERMNDFRPLKRIAEVKTSAIRAFQLFSGSALQQERGLKC
jgi:hypothetical protein